MGSSSSSAKTTTATSSSVNVKSKILWSKLFNRNSRECIICAKRLDFPDLPIETRRCCSRILCMNVGMSVCVCGWIVDMFGLNYVPEYISKVGISQCTWAMHIQLWNTWVCLNALWWWNFHLWYIVECELFYVCVY